MVKLCYVHTVKVSDLDHYCHIVEEFVACTTAADPEMLCKVKIHLLLHLPGNLAGFGPPANYNTERYWILYICMTSVLVL